MKNQCLDESQLGGGNVESINIGSQAAVGLLATVGAEKHVSIQTVMQTQKVGTYRTRVLIFWVSMS